MNLLKPKKLNKGDTIGILALSGVIKNKENILRAKKYFENKGFKIILCENIFDKKRYLAGEDEKKIKELHKFFSNPQINAILCARGGYGAIRLLNKIDFNLIKNNPKIFAGYSDVSSIQAMIYKKTGLITFYSPIAQSDFGAEDVSKITEKSFFNTITNTNNLKISPDERKSKVYFHGESKGRLWGGNLATIVSMCGLEFIPNEKFIFFAEDLNENVYKIDKMMTQLFNIDKFKENLSGIILGDFLNSGNKKYFDELFFEIGNKYKKPILSGFKITHERHKNTIPYGATAEFSTTDKVLNIESYLS
jgi:muramoyltetrapeptide carboxypeptidase